MTTAQIYKGAIAFIVLQLIMVVVVIVFPGLVIDMESKKAIDLDKIQLEAPTGGYGDQAPSDPTKDLMPGAAAGRRAGRSQARPRRTRWRRSSGRWSTTRRSDGRRPKKKPAVR